MDSGGARSTPVLIAGGGPAGLAAAAELSLHGIGCVVIEPRAEVSHRRPRAKTTSVRTMEHLRRWGLAEQAAGRGPAAGRMVAAGHVLRVAVRPPDHRLRRRLRADHRRATTGSPSPASRSRSRSSRRCCAPTCAAQPRVGLRLGHAVTGARRGRRRRDGHRRAARPAAAYRLRAGYVLGCDGYGGVDPRRRSARSYAGRSDPRPNFNVVFRAPGLDTAARPGRAVLGRGRARRA